MKVATIFLQTVIVLTGVGALVLLLWEPQIEGRNAHATLQQIYFNDPFLACGYIASSSFFVALYQAFKLLGYVRHGTAVSQAGVNALRTMKICGIALVGFVALGEIAILFGNSDDRAGGVFMGILVAFGAAILVAIATMFERLAENAMAAKAEAT